jgi:hypothetical protein
MFPEVNVNVPVTFRSLFSVSPAEFRVRDPKSPVPDRVNAWAELPLKVTKPEPCVNVPLFTKSPATFKAGLFDPPLYVAPELMVNVLATVIV